MGVRVLDGTWSSNNSWPAGVIDTITFGYTINCRRLFYHIKVLSCCRRGLYIMTLHEGAAEGVKGSLSATNFAYYGTRLASTNLGPSGTFTRLDSIQIYESGQTQCSGAPFKAEVSIMLHIDDGYSDTSDWDGGSSPVQVT